MSRNNRPNRYNHNKPSSSFGSGGSARRGGGRGGGFAGATKHEQADVRLCKFFMTGGHSNCSTTAQGGQCNFSHCLQRVADIEAGPRGPQGHIKALAAWKNEAGVHIFSASKDGKWKMWSSQTWQQEHEVVMPGEIGCLTVSGPWLLCGYEGETPLLPAVKVGLVKAWNLTNPSLTYDFRISEKMPWTHAGRVYAVVMREAQAEVYTAGHEGNIHCWAFNKDVNAFAVLQRLEGHVLGVTSLILWGPAFLVSGSLDHSIRIWNLDDPTKDCKGILTANTNGHSDGVTALATLKLGEVVYFMSGGMDSQLKVWNSTGSCEFELKLSQPVLALDATLEPGGKPLAVLGLMDSTIELRQPDVGFKLRAVLSNRNAVGHHADVRALCVGDQYFCSGASDGKLMVWQWVTPLPPAPPAQM